MLSQISPCFFLPFVSAFPDQDSPRSCFVSNSQPCFPWFSLFGPFVCFLPSLLLRLPLAHSFTFSRTPSIHWERVTPYA